MIFIDGSNIFHSLQRYKPGYRLDYDKLVKVLVRDRNLVRPYYYCSIGVPPRPKQIDFLKKLKAFHFTVVDRPLKKRGETYVEKGVDVALVTDLLSMAYKNAYDVAIVVSGDKDVQGAIEEVKRLGKRVEVVAFGSSTSEDMKNSGDYFVDLESIADNIRR
jgi:uncharacterized LabA/DUF88 family protein